MDNNNISEIEEPLFRDLHKLNTLILGNNEIESIAERSFDGLQELRNLDLSNNKIEVRMSLFEIRPVHQIIAG